MRYAVRKVLYVIPVLLAVSFLTFLLINLLPGGPEVAILGASASEENREQVREDLNLDRPLPVRYVDWLGDAVTGDFGQSYITNEEVNASINERIGNTLYLLIYAQLIALAIGIPLGILAAQRPGGLLDTAASSTAFVFLAVPSFVLAYVLSYVFGYKLLWFPTLFDADARLWSLFLPALSLGAAEAAVYLRILRSDMIATLQEDYITMAKAKGLSRTRILIRHAFRPSTFTLVTLAGLNMARLIGGAFVIEQIFSINGLGRLAITSVGKRDYLVVQGVVLVVAVAYVLFNLVIDLLYAYLDPRIRHARALS